MTLPSGAAVRRLDVHCFLSLCPADWCPEKKPAEGGGLRQVGTLGCMGSYREMGGKRCCVEVMPGVRWRQDTVSFSA